MSIGGEPIIGASEKCDVIHRSTAFDGPITGVRRTVGVVVGVYGKLGTAPSGGIIAIFIFCPFDV